MNLFFLHLYDTVQKAGNQTLAKELDSNHGCLDRNLENEFQQKLFSIIKVESYTDYLSTLGLEVEDDEASHTKIVDAFKNSRAKGYHGDKEYQSNKESMKEDSIVRITSLIGLFSDLELTKEKIEKDEDDADK